MSKLTAPIPQTTQEFNECTWAQINDLACSAAVDPEPFMFWFEQDFQKEFQFQDATYHARAVDAAHFDLADGSGKAGLSFEFVELSSQLYKMNSTNTNAGGYPETDMYKTTLPSLLAEMPAEMSDLFVEVKLPYNVYNGSGSDDSAFTILETTANFYLHSCREIFGPSQAYGADGTRLAWYAQHDTDNERTKYDTSRNWTYPLRSCRRNDTSFVIVSSTGSQSGSNANSSYHVAPGFSISAPPPPKRATTQTQVAQMINAGLVIAKTELDSAIYGALEASY